MSSTFKRVLGSAARAAAGARGLARDVRQGAGSLLLPAVCPLCGDGRGPAEAATAVCDQCLEAIESGKVPVCRCCASRDPVGSDDGRCALCRGRRFPYQFVTALGPYGGTLRDAVLRTKRPAEVGLTTALAELLWQQSGERLAEFKPDAVVAVPMFWWHRLGRGGNGPDAICDLLARRLGVTSAPNLLARRRNTMPQSNLAPGRRKVNVRRAFRVRSSFVLHAARFILVDDIFTSGATAHEAASTLRKAGAAAVAVAVLARADKPG